MKSLTKICEGLLDPDFDIKDSDVMPEAGQVIIDNLSGLKLTQGKSHNNGFGWLCDYKELKNRMYAAGKALARVRKNMIPKRLANQYLWASGEHSNDDVCIICLVGDPNDPKTIGVGRPSTVDALFFTDSKGYTSTFTKWIEQGLIKDTKLPNDAKIVNRNNVYTYIEGVINNQVARKYWMLPGYCYDAIKRQIVG